MCPSSPSVTSTKYRLILPLKPPPSSLTVYVFLTVIRKEYLIVVLSPNFDSLGLGYWGNGWGLVELGFLTISITLLEIFLKCQ